jgi:putative endonuclease
MSHKDTGNRAELLASRFLEQRGLQPLHKNFHCRRGEIDLIMRDRDSLVFIEVRYRRNKHYGGAAGSVTQTKCRRIAQCARYYLDRYQASEQSIRFDVIAIEGTGNELQIEWLKDAFRPEA